jgi:hypothetical protein
MGAKDLARAFAIDGPGCDGCGDPDAHKRPVTVLIDGERNRRYYCGECNPLEEDGVETVVRDAWRDD